ncbi:MAG TPA: hypothetical protein VGM67_15765 [Gemmatimonadaceae bacterium]|jgi:hypothetical protein
MVLMAPKTLVRCARTILTSLPFVVALTLAEPLAANAQAAQQAATQTPAADTSNDPHAVHPDRPTVATNATTIAPGWLEIEAGVEHDRFASSAIGYTTPVLFKIGLTGRMALGLFGAWSRPTPGIDGLGDTGALLKWRLFDDAPVLGDFALLPSVKFPTGSARSGTGTGTTDASLIAISSHAFGPVSVDFNLGYVRRSGDGLVAPTSASVWTVAGGGPVAGRLGWTLECYGYPGTGGPAGQAPIVATLGGPTFLVRPWLQLDAGAIVPLTGPQPHAFYAGATYNVGRLWRQRN